MMRKPLLLLAALALLSAPAFAQTSTPNNTFSVNLSALSLPGGKQTVAATDAGATFNLTQNLQLREDNLIAPASNFQFFGAGFNYYLPVLSTKLNNVSPTLSGARFQFWITASAGIDRITNISAQHYAFRGGGGVAYDLTGSGKWTFGAEVQYGKFPGLQNNTWTAAISPAFHF